MQWSFLLCQHFGTTWKVWKWSFNDLQLQRDRWISAGVICRINSLSIPCKTGENQPESSFPETARRLRVLPDSREPQSEFLYRFWDRGRQDVATNDEFIPAGPAPELCCAWEAEKFQAGQNWEQPALGEGVESCWNQRSLPATTLPLSTDPQNVVTEPAAPPQIPQTHRGCSSPHPQPPQHESSGPDSSWA